MQKNIPHDDQETDIEDVLAELAESHGYVCAHDMGLGKSTIGSEIMLRGIDRFGWSRVLLIALPNTHKDWAARITAQADGAPPFHVRIMNGTKAGAENLARFMKHEPGIYIAGSAYLQEKDWEARRKLDEGGRPIHKIAKKTGLPEFKERPVGEFIFEAVEVDLVDDDGLPFIDLVDVEIAGRKGMIGPALEPVFETEVKRKNFFDRFSRKPLDAILFDEVQVIANRKSKGRQTILSIKANDRVALSGTWFNNKVENQWSIARWVWPGNRSDGTPYVETNFGKWSETWLLREDVTGRGGKALESPHGGTIKRVTGEKVPGAFAASLPGYIRREAERPPAPELLYVDPMPEQARQMEELQRDLMSWVMNWQGQEAPLVVDMPIVLRTRLKQVCIAALSVTYDGAVSSALAGSAGMAPTAMSDALAEAWHGGIEKVTMHPDAQSAKLAPLRWLLEEKWKGQPVAIYTDSKIGAYFIRERMRRSGVDARAWTGDLSQKQREQLKQEFIAGDFPYLIATIPSFGTGIDGLQRVCNKLAWISHVDGNPSLNDQALARFFRQGRLITDPDHPFGGFEHARILMRDSVDVESLESTLNTAWQMRQALNAGQPAA